MCMICVGIEKEKLTFKEAWRNYKEMYSEIEKDHKLIVKQRMVDQMVKERKDEVNKRKA